MIGGHSFGQNGIGNGNNKNIYDIFDMEDFSASGQTGINEN